MTTDEPQDGEHPPKESDDSDSGLEQMVTRDKRMFQQAAKQHRNWARAVGANRDLSKRLAQLTNATSGILRPGIEQLRRSAEVALPDLNHSFNLLARQSDAVGMQTLPSSVQKSIQESLRQYAPKFEVPLSALTATHSKLFENVLPDLRQIQGILNRLNQPAATSNTRDFITGADGPLHGGSHWLWHYTNAHALDQVLRQHTLWASSPHNLNDTSELTHGVKIIRAAVDRAGELEEHAMQILREVVNESFIKEAMHEIYYLSTSTAQDSLTLWRNYSTSSGFAIGLRPRQALSAEGLIFERRDEDPASTLPSTAAWYSVQYKEGRKKVLADSFVSSAIKDIAAIEPQDSELVITELRKHMLVLASTMKHEAFADEREVRWITASWAPIDVVHYEVTGRGFVPVLHVRTAGVSDADQNLPIVGLRCAPTSSLTIERTMSGLLQQRGYENAAKDVRKSTMPFQG